MTKPAHTPGEWDYKTTRFDRKTWDALLQSNVFTVGVGAEVVAIVYGCSDLEEKTNARLISASPLLLEALKECAGALSIMGAPDEALVKARQAINKAEGHS